MRRTSGANERLLSLMVRHVSPHRLFRTFLYSFLILLTLITVSYWIFCLIDVNLDMLFLKIKITLFRKSLGFLFFRLGWCTGGLLVLAVFCSLFDPDSWGMPVAPSGVEDSSPHIKNLPLVSS